MFGCTRSKRKEGNNRSNLLTVTQGCPPSTTEILLSCSFKENVLAVVALLTAKCVKMILVQICAHPSFSFVIWRNVVEVNLRKVFVHDLTSNLFFRADLVEAFIEGNILTAMTVSVLPVAKQAPKLFTRQRRQKVNWHKDRFSIDSHTGKIDVGKFVLFTVVLFAGVVGTSTRQEFAAFTHSRISPQCTENGESLASRVLHSLQNCLDLHKCGCLFVCSFHLSTLTS